jgi:hypothetical protein
MAAVSQSYYPSTVKLSNKKEKPWASAGSLSDGDGEIIRGDENSDAGRWRIYGEELPWARESVVAL